MLRIHMAISTSKDTLGGRPSPPTAPGVGTRDTSQSHAWLWVCLILLVVTWMPVFTIHFYKMSLSAPSTGTVVVVFSPILSTRDLFHNVSAANGSLVRPVRWFPRMWVVRSLDPGFVGRLKARGAWGVYSTDLLSAQALLNCFQIVTPLNSDPATPGPSRSPT